MRKHPEELGAQFVAYHAASQKPTGLVYMDVIVFFLKFTNLIKAPILTKLEVCPAAVGFPIVPFIS